MTDDGWIALGLESGGVGAYDALYEGVPTWMAASFWEWVKGELTITERSSNPYGSNSYLRWDVAKFQRLERACRFSSHYEGADYGTGMTALRKAAGVDEMRAVRVADFLIGDPASRTGRAAGERLETILRESGSAWTVGTRLDRLGLLRRVPQGVQDAADHVMRTSHRAGQRLAQAWAAAFGLDPSPSSAYSLAVKAVEDAAIPALLPNDETATLGKVITHLRDVTYQLPFEREHPDAASGLLVKQMCQLLWMGQFDRHGGLERATGTITQDIAEAAVVLAVPLVQWFTSGHVRRT